MNANDSRTYTTRRTLDKDADDYRNACRDEARFETGDEVLVEARDGEEYVAAVVATRPNPGDDGFAYSIKLPRGANARTANAYSPDKLEAVESDDEDDETPESGAVTVHRFDRDAYDGDDDHRFVADDLRRGEVEITAERFASWFAPRETVLGTTDLDAAFEATQGHVVNREQGGRHMVASASPGDVFEVYHEDGTTEFYRVARMGFEELDLGGEQ